MVLRSCYGNFLGGDILAIIFENILCNFVYFLGTVRAQISVDMSPGFTIIFFIAQFFIHPVK